MALDEEGNPQPMWLVGYLGKVEYQGSDEYLYIFNPLTKNTTVIRREPWILIYDSVEEAAKRADRDLTAARNQWPN